MISNFHRTPTIICTITLNIVFILLHICHFLLRPLVSPYIIGTIKNWSWSPIMAIYSSDYPGNSKEIALTEFLGTHPGCFCSEQSSLDKGTCSRAELNSHCANIEATPKIIYSSWRGKELRVTRFDPFSKYNYIKYYEIDKAYSSFSQCQAPYPKTCGLIDHENYLCVAAGVGCPINDIQITNTSTSPNSRYSYTTIELSGGMYLHYTNENRYGRILVDWRVTQGKMCQNYERHDWVTHDNPWYKGEKNQICETDGAFSWFDYQYDEGYVRVDTMEKKAFYNFNVKFEKDVFNAIPDYDWSGEVTLYSRNYRGLEWFVSPGEVTPTWLDRIYFVGSRVQTYAIIKIALASVHWVTLLSALVFYFCFNGGESPLRSLQIMKIFELLLIACAWVFSGLSWFYLAPAHRWDHNLEGFSVFLRWDGHSRQLLIVEIICVLVSAANGVLIVVTAWIIRKKIKYGDTPASAAEDPRLKVQTEIAASNQIRDNGSDRVRNMEHAGMWKENQMINQCSKGEIVGDGIRIQGRECHMGSDPGEKGGNSLAAPGIEGERRK